MFHPCRLLVFLTLVFVSLLASSPAFAARDTPEDEKSLTIRNESAEELLSIRFTVGNQANYARLDLLPGGEDQLLNPGGTAEAAAGSAGAFVGVAMQVIVAVFA